MANFYCEYCGAIQASILNLTAGSCPKHPNGRHKGNHKLYEGGEKSQYTCKYCGNKQASILNLAAGSCPRHPDGRNKGNHVPAL